MLDIFTQLGLPVSEETFRHAPCLALNRGDFDATSSGNIDSVSAFAAEIDSPIKVNAMGTDHCVMDVASSNLNWRPQLKANTPIEGDIVHVASRLNSWPNDYEHTQTLSIVRFRSRVDDNGNIQWLARRRIVPYRRGERNLAVRNHDRFKPQRSATDHFPISVRVLEEAFMDDDLRDQDDFPDIEWEDDTDFSD